MKVVPSVEEVRELAKTGKYDVVPVSCEILSDFTTPIETIRILKNASTHAYMLESAQADEKWGRYTFLGFDPKLEITCINGEITYGDKTEKTDDPSKIIREIMSHFKSPRLPYLPSFTGGLVGYFSYDYLGYAEPTAKRDVIDTENFKDVDLMLFDKVIAFDHVRQKRNGVKAEENDGKLLSEVTPLFSKEEYCAMVEKAKRHIHEGDIFQIVLSNRLSASFEGSLLNTYRILRTINVSLHVLLCRNGRRGCRCFS